MNIELTPPIIELRNICKKVREAEEDKTSEVEPFYEKLLKFLRENESSRNEFMQVLIAAVRHFKNARNEGRGELSIDAIAYCMHELRWSEVLKVALEEHQSYFVPKRSSTLLRLIEAFDDDWSEAEDYLRFSNQ